MLAPGVQLHLRSDESLVRFAIACRPFRVRWKQPFKACFQLLKVLEQTLETEGLTAQNTPGYDIAPQHHRARHSPAKASTADRVTQNELDGGTPIRCSGGRTR